MWLKTDSGEKNITEAPFSSVQFSSVAQSCSTLCDPMNRSTPGLPVHHQLPEFTQSRVHRVSDAIQPSHSLSSPSPPAPSPSQHQSLLQWVNSSHDGLFAYQEISWNFLGKNPGVDCHSLLQGIFLTQGSNPSLLIGSWTLYFWATWEVLIYIWITSIPYGEGNGIPLQHSCLENPMDGGAW